MIDAVITIDQYYITESGILVGVRPGTSIIMKLLPYGESRTFDSNTITVGYFNQFDPTTRILKTASRKEIHLPPEKMERSRVLLDRTKQWLNRLSKGLCVSCGGSCLQDQSSVK